MIGMPGGQDGPEEEAPEHGLCAGTQPPYRHQGDQEQAQDEGDAGPGGMVERHHLGCVIAHTGQKARWRLRCVGWTEKPQEIAQMLGQQQPHQRRPDMPAHQRLPGQLQTVRRGPPASAPPAQQAEEDDDVGDLDDVVRRIQIDRVVAQRPGLVAVLPDPHAEEDDRADQPGGWPQQLGPHQAAQIEATQPGPQ